MGPEIMSMTELRGFWARNRHWVTAGKVLLGAIAGIAITIFTTGYSSGSANAHLSDRVGSVEKGVVELGRRVDKIQKQSSLDQSATQNQLTDIQVKVGKIEAHDESLDDNFKWLRQEILNRRR